MADRRQAGSATSCHEPECMGQLLQKTRDRQKTRVIVH